MKNAACPDLGSHVTSADLCVGDNNANLLVVVDSENDEKKAMPSHGTGSAAAGSVRDPSTAFKKDLGWLAPGS
jgi:hypothetical protein